MHSMQQLQARAQFVQALPFNPKPFYSDPQNNASGIIWGKIIKIERKILEFERYNSQTTSLARDILTDITFFAKQYFDKFKKLSSTVSAITDQLKPHLYSNSWWFSTQASIPADLFKPVLILFHFFKVSSITPNWWGSERADLLKRYPEQSLSLNADYLNDILQIFLSQNNSSCSQCLRDWRTEGWGTIGAGAEAAPARIAIDDSLAHTAVAYHLDGNVDIRDQLLTQFKTLCTRHGFNLNETDFIYAHTTQSGLLGQIMSFFYGVLLDAYSCNTNGPTLLLQKNGTAVTIGRDRISGKMQLNMHTYFSLQNSCGTDSNTYENIAKLNVTIETGQSWERLTSFTPDIAPLYMEIFRDYSVPNDIKILVGYSVNPEKAGLPIPGMPRQVKNLFEKTWPVGRVGCAEIKLDPEFF
ncbi:MAG: hypothetical protein EXR81_02040 [Gammaproteobacteria bacterium]|nr:hypothetical protein [Gammaproteobacteria bacterium]